MRILRNSDVLVMLLLGGPALALAGEPNCDSFIDSAPYTISAPGHYCLTRDVALAGASGTAITINANLAVLDLRGYALEGSADAGTAAVGIRVSNRNGVVVRNGAVRGFQTGVELDGSLVASGNTGNLVEDIRADANTRFGIWVSDLGSDVVVRNCRVTATGGSTTGTSYAAGIYMRSTYSFALDNIVTGTRAASGGTLFYGLRLSGPGRAINNQVMNGDGSTSTSYCFYFSPIVLYKDNVASMCGTAYGGSGSAVGTTNYP
jgi:hypothetical protein